ncbi:MAG: hypothetical protein QOH72_4479 [Solirubrobacteraceae bacterium]|nr:hypothetical protein [Solirubrobacteraceae bacterium]
MAPLHRAFAIAAVALLVGAVPARAQDAVPRAPAADPPTSTVAPAVPGAARDDRAARDDPGAPPPGGADRSPGVVDGARSSGDPLAANGLGGALCRSDRLAGGLSAAAQDNCRTAGITAAPAPITHYGFDIHIDTGTIGVSGRTFVAALQTLVLTPLWTLLLWVVHAVLAVLEWSYALDLLDATTVGSLATALRSARELFTQPWLPLALAVASVGLFYSGLVRRRLAESAGQAAAMAVMMILGLAAIADPAGTVGEADALVQSSSLGTVAAVSARDPAHAEASFADALRGVFATVVEAPWCYLEFGDVQWCRDPARLDDRLTHAARNLAGPDRAGLRCGPPRCPDGDDRDRAAALLGRATTNGDLFLAFPANGDERNSINDVDSLFRTLCGADNDDHCSGPTAAQARWRTETGTWPRAGGLALITAGILGMVALLGFLALRLLGAAIIAMLCLLLAPVAVLAPALGEGGRSAFRAWGMRLLGALVSKLLYSAFLGVVLLALHILEGMGALGWWTQWLLVAAFWWIVFSHRHRVLEFATLSHSRAGARAMSATARVITGHRLATIGTDVALPARRLGERARHTTRRATHEGRGRLRDQRDQLQRERADGVATGARKFRGAQADRLAEQAARSDARARQRVPHAEATVDRLQARRARLATQIAQARGAGDFKRVARLRARDRAVADAIAAQRPPSAGRGGGSGERGTFDVPGGVGERHGWLDHQATLRRGVPPGPRADPAAYRDYPRLAALVGMGESDYRALPPGAQRRVRLDVDRALRARVQATQALTAAEPGRRETATPVPPRAAIGRHAPGDGEIAPRRLSPRERQFGSVDPDRPRRVRRRRPDDAPDG